MASRLNKRQQQSSIEKIKVSNVITKLQKHLNGDLELSNTQLKAAEILLRKSLPDLKQTDMSVEGALEWKLKL